jgi:hypothetical protein
MEAAASIDNSFCGLPINVGIGSRYDFDIDAHIDIDDDDGRFRRPTSLAVVVYNERTTAVIGTESGHVIKVRKPS